jgi:hypothetical protein
MNTTSRISNRPKLLADRSTSVLVAGRGNSPEISREATLFFIEEIHARADAVTPLLKEILDFRPRPHWEAN